MKILLDIDGVMVTTPSWKSTEMHEDGFMKFNVIAANNLSKLVSETNASIILTTTHRISYSESEWKQILFRRGINVSDISKINNCTTIQSMLNRGTEIKEWVDNQKSEELFVIIDDDSSISNLNESIKAKWVKTSSLIGFNNEALENARRVLKIY